MSFTENKRVYSLIILLISSMSVGAIDISVSNPSISMDPIAVGSTYNISFDINNQASPIAVTPEDAVFIVAGLSGYDMGNVASLVSASLGWNCILSASAVDCDRSFSIGAFPPGTTETLVITLMSGSLVLNPDTFTIMASEDGGPNENNFGDNTTTISTSGVSPPDFNVALIAIDGITSTTTLDFEEGTFASQNAHFRVMNAVASGNAPNGGTLSMFFDDFNFSLADTSVPPGWNCVVVSPGKLDCSTSTLINSGANLDFFFDFAPTQTLSAGSFASLDAFIIDANGVDPNPFDNDAMVPVNIVSVTTTDLEVIKAAKDSPGGAVISSALIDTPFVYSIQVNNLSVTAGNNIEITDNVPAGIEITGTSQSNPSWNCNMTPFVNVSSSQTVTCTRSTIAANQPNFNELIFLDAIGRSVSIGAPFINTATITALDEGDLNPSNDTDTANMSINPPLPPDIVVSKTFLQGVTNTGTAFEALEGSFVTYEILASAIDVGGSGPGSNVQISDTLPAGVAFDSFNVIGSNFNCSQSSGVVLCTAANLPITTADDGVEIRVLVTGVVGDPPVVNTATVTASNDSDGSNNSSATPGFNIVSTLPTTITVDTQAVQSGAPVQSISGGDSFSYRIAIQNTGSFDALNIQAIDDLPAGVLVNSVTGAGWSCNNSAQQYTCDFPGPLAPNATTFLSFNVVDVSDSSVTQLLNLVNVTAANAPTVSDAIFINITNVSLDVQVTQNPNPIEEGQFYDVIIDMTNTGSEDIQGVQVVNTLPNGFSYAATSSNCIINGQDMTCTIAAAIAPGTVESIVVGVQALPMANSSATYINTTTVSGNNIPTPIVIQTVTNVSATGSGSGDFNFDISLTADMNPVETGIAFNYIVNVENTGSNNITFMDIDLDVPSDLLVLSMMSNGFTCSSASSGLSCSADQGFDLAAGANLDVIQIEVQSDVFVGDVTVDLTSRIGTVLVRTANATTTITSPAVLSSDVRVEVVSGSSIDQGDISEFEIQVTNDGPGDAQEVTLSMVVTGILDGVSVVPGGDWSCQTNNFSVECQFNSASLPSGHSSSVFVTANTTQVVVSAEDVVVMATVETSSEDSDLSNNTASSFVGVSGTPTEGNIGSALRDVIGSSGNPQVDRAISNISAYCEQEFFTALEGLCDDLYSDALSGESESVLNFLEEVTPNEVIGQSTSVNEIAGAQFRNIGARLNQLRGGGGSGLNTAGLNARYGNGSIPLGMLSYLNKSEEEAKSKNIDTNNDFISPWGFFVNGTISMGDRSATSRELAFDFDTFGITAGVDYRIDAKKVVGVALGYANFDSNIDGTAELNSSGVTLTGYGSFYVTDNFYVDTRISLAKPDFDQSREIDFTLGSTRVNRTAAGSTSGNQYSVSMSAGYSFYKNAWNITPNTSFTYMSTKIDNFTESGAGAFNFFYSDQDLESLVWSAGLRVSKAISMKKGVITPQFDFDYNYQGLNENSFITARFIEAPDDQLFILETDTPDRSYGTAGIGLVYISANGRQAYFNYRTVLGLEGFSVGTYNIGARFEF
ncbi:MAG: autotransporter domain-containing protein [Proteobacteria bacterium]|nr:autotransporter domain-containing protein [Pseudomonadota bacterium]